ncbi:WhiB family transcriptional regulator [Streptomyces sp. NPDC059534]|uniref:WhiB family transcriptional regulator n=1 Tax=Streptomyces sp. NPDC059534 TaxID=3346859 RepID=UPI00367DB623
MPQKNRPFGPGVCVIPRRNITRLSEEILHPCEADPDLWFSGKGEDAEAAKEACGFCPARVECAELGENEDFGIWGGMTPDEIRRARRFRVILLEEMNNSRIREMCAAGVSISAMSRELGIPRKTLTDRIRKILNLAA